MVDGLILGLEVYPNGATISLENGVFNERLKIVGIKFRCITCDSRYRFKEFLWHNFLDADGVPLKIASSHCGKAPNSAECISLGGKDVGEEVQIDADYPRHPRFEERRGKA